jgi:putative adhesin/cell wall-active antibiotic response 4TMS protein YvqF
MANSYRRDSIFWALTLIAIGGLFLYANFHHEASAWQIIGKYWPILIIFWGLSKLYAYFKFRHDPNVPPGPFITGGEIVGLVFLLIIGTAISSGVRHSSRFFNGPGIQIGDDNETLSFDGLFGNPFDSTEQVEAAAKPKAVIEIPDVRGNIKVTGWDQPKIMVQVKKRVYADNEDEAKARADLNKTTISEEGGKYKIVTSRQDASSKGYRISVELEINVPKDSQVTTNQQRGDVSFAGLVGDQSIDSTRGDIEVAQIVGNVVIAMRRGDLKVNDVTGNADISGRGNDVSLIKIGGNGSVKGEFFSVDFQDVKKQARFLSSRTDLLADTVEGDIRLESGNLTVRNIKGPFTVKTRDKDIRIEEVVGPVRVDNSRGNVQYRASLPPKADIEIRTQSSSIDMELPRSASFQIDGKTKSGDIQTDFKAPTLKVTQDQPTNEISGSVGKGGPHVRLETTYGNLKVTQL